MELGVSHVQSLSSSTPIVDNAFDTYNKNLVPIRSLSDHDINFYAFVYKSSPNWEVFSGSDIDIRVPPKMFLKIKPRSIS